MVPATAVEAEQRNAEIVSVIHLTLELVECRKAQHSTYLPNSFYYLLFTIYHLLFTIYW